ncbi:hypothetical protein Bxe_A0917 [Paraburkholderia xenovorans LB400]|uniref:Uncharacterized protein n=1 Tax=Paraburkholderia xenovorans (strain LB400) TaxID=266265 RepID=Q13V61_PARXL|nr:hypothetical protein Bxe_A0917 [Paraburkholderia xenovorans LB400]
MIAKEESADARTGRATDKSATYSAPMKIPGACSLKMTANKGPPFASQRWAFLFTHESRKVFSSSTNRADRSFTKQWGLNAQTEMVGN